MGILAKEERETRVLYCACNGNNELKSKFFKTTGRLANEVSQWNRYVPEQQRLKIVPFFFKINRGMYELLPNQNIIVHEFFKQFCKVKQ